MLFGEREWWDFVVYNPIIEPLGIVRRYERDDKFIAAFEKHLIRFHDELWEACERRSIAPDWRERIQARSDERAAMEAEERKYFPPQETAERPDVDRQREFLGRKHATDTQAAFEAGAQVQ